jgi:hypothetical protein
MSMTPKQHTGDGHVPGTGGQPTTATARVNEPVRDGKLEFVVTNAANRGGYFTVTMTARNIGDEAQTFFAGNRNSSTARVAPTTPTVWVCMTSTSRR